MLYVSKQIKRTTINHFVGFAVSVSAAVLFFGGCDSDKKHPEMIIGDWQSDSVRCSDYDWLEIDDDLKGEGRLFFISGEDNKCYYSDFDIEVSVISPQLEYEIDFESDADPLLDFTMECEVNDDIVECEGDDLWSAYEWEWELD